MTCPYCGKKAQWCENKIIYGRNYGKSYMCYYCADCDAYVGCHQNTQIPLGTMANKELRGLRIKAHNLIDPLWKSGKMKRGDVYKALVKMGIKHISWANEIDNLAKNELARLIETYQNQTVNLNVKEKK